jgi:hypothetical protein
MGVLARQYCLKRYSFSRNAGGGFWLSSLGRGRGDGGRFERTFYLGANMKESQITTLILVIGIVSIFVYWYQSQQVAAADNATTNAIQSASDQVSNGIQSAGGAAEGIFQGLAAVTGNF